MAKGIFLDKSVKLDRDMLASVLGNTLNVWNALAEHIEVSYPLVSTEIREMPM